MGHRPPQPCRRYGCPQLTTEGYCPEHKRQQYAEDVRPERLEGTTLQNLRWKIFRRDQHCCVPCRKKGIIRKATEMDHVIPMSEGGTNHPKNLQSICYDCHRVKTRQERHERNLTIA